MIKKESELKKRYQFWKNNNNLTKQQKEEANLIVNMLGGYSCESDCDCAFIEE